MNFDWSSIANFLKSDTFANLGNMAANIYGAYQTGQTMDLQRGLMKDQWAMQMEQYRRRKTKNRWRDNLVF